MSDFLMAHETTIRLAVFLGFFIVLAIWEITSPRRRDPKHRLLRWINNISIVVLNTVILRLAFPVVAVGLAIQSENRSWGLFNIIDLPVWLEVVVAILLLDLAIYLQHVVFHQVPILWRLHRLHHADIEFDVTTALRFHPIEIILSMLIKLAVVFALGAPAMAVLVFEIVLNGAAMFNHANIRLPLRLDHWLRRIIVTPDMHRVHHSIYPVETNSNYGFNLPWWDYLFRTYCAEPRAGHEDMTIGLEQFRTPRDLRLDQMLIQPWRK